MTQANIDYLSTRCAHPQCPMVRITVPPYDSIDGIPTFEACCTTGCIRTAVDQWRRYGDRIGHTHCLIIKMFMNAGYWDVGIMLITISAQEDCKALKYSPLLHQFLKHLISLNTYGHLDPRLFRDCMDARYTLPGRIGTLVINVTVHGWGNIRSDWLPDSKPDLPMFNDWILLALESRTKHITIEHLHPFLVTVASFDFDFRELWTALDKVWSNTDPSVTSHYIELFSNEPIESKLRLYCWVHRLDLLELALHDPVFEQGSEAIVTAHLSCLEHACRISDIDMLAILLSVQPVCMEIEYGSLFIITSSINDSEIIQMLISACLERKYINYCLFNYSIPLAIRKSDSDLEIIRPLLEAFKPYLSLNTVYDIYLWHVEQVSREESFQTANRYLFNGKQIPYNKSSLLAMGLIKQIFPQIESYDSSLSTNRDGNRPDWWNCW